MTQVYASPLIKPERRQDGRKQNGIPKAHHQTPSRLCRETEIPEVNAGEVKRGLPEWWLAAHLDDAAVVRPRVAVEPHATVEEADVKTRRDGQAMSLHVELLAHQQGNQR